MLDRVYVVSTPENLELRFRRGGLASRSVALAIDVATIAALLQAASWLLSPFAAQTSAAATALWIVAAFAIQWGYGALCEWQVGCTLGKRLLGLRVVDHDGLRPSLRQAATRNLLRLVDFLPGLHLVGALACLLDPLGRRLGDLAAQTVVVQTARAPQLGTPARLPNGSPATAYAGALAAQLRPAERTALQALTSTLDHLPLELRLRLCEQLEGHLTAQHGGARPAHLSSEGALLLIEATLQRLPGKRG